MGCKLTRTNPSSIVNTTASPAPVYVKSVLKTSRKNGTVSTSSGSNRDNPQLNKSVNFHEKVEVKLRTPTPRARYDMSPSKTFGREQTFTDDDDDDESVVSFSSSEDISNSQFRTQTIAPNPSIQRKQSNSFWHKNNSVAAQPRMNDSNNDRNPFSPPPIMQQPSPPMSDYSTEHLLPPKERSSRVRRQIHHSVLPQSSHGSKVQSAPISTERSLPNTNVVLVEHRASFANGESSSQPAYYAFSRRPVDNTKSTKN